MSVRERGEEGGLSIFQLEWAEGITSLARETRSKENSSGRL